MGGAPTTGHRSRRPFLCAGPRGSVATRPASRPTASVTAHAVAIVGPVDPRSTRSQVERDTPARLEAWARLQPRRVLASNTSRPRYCAWSRARCEPRRRFMPVILVWRDYRRLTGSLIGQPRTRPRPPAPCCPIDEAAVHASTCPRAWLPEISASMGNDRWTHRSTPRGRIP